MKSLTHSAQPLNTNWMTDSKGLLKMRLPLLTSHLDQMDLHKAKVWNISVF